MNCFAFCLINDVNFFIKNVNCFGINVNLFGCFVTSDVNLFWHQCKLSFFFRILTDEVSFNHLFWTVLNENQYTHSSDYVLLDFCCKNIHDDLGQHNNLDATKQWITLKLWGTHVESMFQYSILFLCCVSLNLFLAELLHSVSDFVTYLNNPFVPDVDLRLLSWTLIMFNGDITSFSANTME